MIEINCNWMFVFHQPISTHFDLSTVYFLTTNLCASISFCRRRSGSLQVNALDLYRVVWVKALARSWRCTTREYRCGPANVMLGDISVLDKHPIRRVKIASCNCGLFQAFPVARIWLKLLEPSELLENYAFMVFYTCCRYICSSELFSFSWMKLPPSLKANITLNNLNT